MDFPCLATFSIRTHRFTFPRLEISLSYATWELSLLGSEHPGIAHSSGHM